MREAWKVILYAGMLLTGIGLVSTGLLPGYLTVPLIVVFLGLIGATFLRTKKAEVESAVIAVAFLLTGKVWGLGGVLIALGLYLWRRGVGRDSLLMAGTGEVLMLGGVVFLLPGSLRPVALLGALFLLIGYLLAWRNPELTGSVLGFGILGALLGAYVSVRPLLAERHPEAVFYAEWLALVVAVAVAVGIVWKRTERPEEYLENLLGKTPSLRIPPEERVERIVREFLLTGRKAELLSYVAFYGSRAFGNREEFKRAIELLSEYEPRRPGPLTPFWLRRRILRNELERRKKLIEELFSRLGVSP